MGNVKYAPSASSDAFFLFHRRCVRAGMYEKKPRVAGLHVLNYRFFQTALLDRFVFFFANLRRYKGFYLAESPFLF